MQPIEYEITAIKQKTSECMQTAATQLIAYYDPSITVIEVINKVPIYVENGEKIGTSPGHLASFLAAKGYTTTTHIFDVELFDLSWANLSPQEIIQELDERAAHIPQNSWLSKYSHVLIDGWKQYVEKGGLFDFPVLSSALLHQKLAEGPFMIMVNSTYLNRQSKERYNKASDSFDRDAIGGRSMTHAVTAAGYKDDKFLIVDPDPPRGTDQHRWVDSDHLIASIMSAQTESDNFIITIKK